MLIDTPNIATYLNILVPGKPIDGIDDLGVHLETTSIVQAVFNEHWYAVPNPGTGLQTFDIFDYQKAKMFQVYKINQKEVVFEIFEKEVLYTLRSIPTLPPKPILGQNHYPCRMGNHR